MSFEATSEKISSKPGLVFDADTITLAGKFTDEISAYRAKKRWIETFNNHFLLEGARDYEMSVKPLGELFVLSCIFHSACGRYAFWRLVNHQAPDAEAKLYSSNMVSRRSARYLLGSIWNSNQSSPWILTGTDINPRGNRSRKPTLIGAVWTKIQEALK